MKDVTLGILGGLGPMSGVLFCELITEYTNADTDQQHLNFLLSSRATTPDRTAFIMGDSQKDPAPIMISEVQKLARAGADVIAIPCNTAHYFYEQVASASDVPIINIITETVNFCKHMSYKKVGVLSTRGTSSSGAYSSALCSAGIEYLSCTPDEQEYISDVIYNKIKRGILPDKDEFLSLTGGLYSRGCETVILGCTELSILKKSFGLQDGYVDSLEVLALCAIRACNKEPRGLPDALMSYFPKKYSDYHPERKQ